MYGKATLTLDLETDAPLKHLAVRINDVAEDGTSTRVVFAIRNLDLDDQLDAPQNGVKTGRKTVTITFQSTAYRVKAGHRLRLAISSSYWPLVWPAPESGGIKIVTGQLTLPIFQGAPAPLSQALPDPLDLPAEKSFELVTSAALERFDSTTDDGHRVSGWVQPYNELFYKQIQTAFGYNTKAEYEMFNQDVRTAKSRLQHRQLYKRPDGTAEIQCQLTTATDGSDFILEGSFSARWQEDEISSHTWNVRIPRGLTS
jgi:hypothetical protein